MDVTRPDAGWYDEPPPPRRGRKLRWAAFVLLLLAVVFAAGYFSWSKRAEQRLNEYVAELRRKGEPVEPQDLVHGPIPAEDDAAIDLLAAAAALDKAGPLLDAMGKIEFDEPLGAADRETIAKLVEAERDVLDKIRDARGKRDADWRIPYQSPALMTLLPHLNDLRTLANVSRAAAVHERLRGNDAAAFEHLRDALAIGEASEQPVMVGHLVAIGVRALATHEIGRMAPDLAIRTAAAGGPGGAAGGATPEQVRAAIGELLDEARSEQGFRDGLRGDRVMQLDTTRLLADRKLDLNAISGAGPGRGGVGSVPLPRGMILGDALIMATQLDELVEAYEASPDYPTFKQKAPGMPPALTNKRMFHIVAGMLMPSYDRYVAQQFRSKTDRRLAAVALALRLYAADHNGKYPQALDELVPRYLPAVPNDPFAAGDKPLRYATDDPAAPIVYSVGENGIDENGSRTPIRKGRATTSLGHWDTVDAFLQMKPSALVKSAEQEELEKKKAAEEGTE